MSIRVLFAAGGTGGHVYPAISIADALKQRAPGCRFLFAGTKDHMEWTAVPAAGYAINSIWISGFHRQFTLKNSLFPLKLMVSVWQSAKLIKTFKPDVVVACGGYVSGPVGWVAAKLGVVLVLQEQNSCPGVTTRLLARYATRIFTAFPEAAQWLPAAVCKLYGNPVRGALKAANRSESLAAFGFSERKKTLLVMGGSGGARAINDAVAEHMVYLHDTLDLQILWQCGKNYFESLKDQVDAAGLKHLRLMPFIEDMAGAYAVSDLVVSRAGAGSIAELTVLGKAMILVPSPNVAGDHQLHNARSVAGAGAARVLTDQDLKSTLPEEIASIIENDGILEQMRRESARVALPGAADRIAGDILKLVRKRSAA